MLEITQQGRILRIVLNRPEKRNALSLEFCRQLVAAIDTADNDRTVGAILLLANGPAFSAGMDLDEALSEDPLSLNRIHEMLFTLNSRITTPIIAAVDGPALAGGTGLVANAHIVVASERATFGLTEVRIGLWPFLIFRSVALAIGERRAVELSLTGRIVEAAEARAIGLIHEVAENARERATAIAARISESSFAAIHSGLNYVQEIRGKSWEEAGEIGRRLRDQVFQSGDFAEGVAAHRSKRAPIWPSVPR